MEPWILYTLLVINLVTLLAFGFDKLRARQGWSRTPESTLILLVFCTGLLGGWAGMHLFRHKTRKTTFQGKMVMASIFNLAWPLIYFFN